MRVLAVATVVLIFLAGCSEGAMETPDGVKAKDVAPPKTGLGSISGVVVDPTITPIADATVTLLGQGKNTTTNADGQFVFEDIEPGAYFLKGSAKDHTEVQYSVEVLPDQVVAPRMMLEPITPKDPYHVTYKRNTYNLLSVPVVIVYTTGEHVDLDGPFETLVIDGAWHGDVLVAIDPEKAINTVVSSDPAGWKGSWNTPLEFSIRVDRSDGMPNDLAGLDWNSKPSFDSVSAQAQGEMFFTSFYNEAAPADWSLHNGDQ